ncbi:MAG: hypothetical protein AAF195_04510 [Pseudomonadota bacterium]
MQYKNLIAIINDPTAREDEIDDAIIDLGDYVNQEVLNFLFA